MSGHLELVLKYWIHVEVAKDYLEDNPNWVLNEGQEYIESQIEQNKISNKKFSRLPKKLLEEKLLVKPASLLWASSQWSHLAEKLFLESNHGLDQISLETFSSEDNAIMTEVYYRLVDDSQSASDIIKSFPSISTMTVKSQDINTLPAIILQAISRLKSRDIQISKPLKVDNNFIVLNVLDYVPSALDDQMTMRLMGMLLTAWIDMVAAKIENDFVDSSFAREQVT